MSLVKGSVHARPREVNVKLVGSSQSISVDPEALTDAATPAGSQLVTLARQIQTADSFVHANAVNKLSVIADQIRYLQNKAREVLVEAKQNAILHHAACNVKKIPGNYYHLYERDGGEAYFSLLSPEEWGGKPPHRFLNSYRLENDMSWTPVDLVDRRSEDLADIERLIARTQNSRGALDGIGWKE